MKQFQGIYPALLTPFTADNQINETVLRQLVRWNLKKQVTGFYVGGSTAEAFLLSADERKRLLEIVADECAGRAVVIAHVGAISTDVAENLARHAAANGADAISSIPPFYYKFTMEEIKRYYFDLADAVDLPVLVYHFPAFSGVSFTPDDADEFLSDSRFMGIKYTASDFYMLERIKQQHPDKVVFNGFDEMFMAGLAMGADGGIGSTYNFMAEKFIAIRRYMQNGEIKAAQAIQQEVNQVIQTLLKVGIFAGEKEILCQLGFDFGICRRPFQPLNDAGKQEIAAIMPLFEAWNR